MVRSVKVPCKAVKTVDIGEFPLFWVDAFITVGQPFRIGNIEKTAQLFRMAALRKVIHVDLKICDNIFSLFYRFIDILGSSKGFSAAGPSVDEIDHIKTSLSFQTDRNISHACDGPGSGGDRKAGGDKFLQDKINDDLFNEDKSIVNEHTVEPCQHHDGTGIKRQEPVEVGEEVKVDHQLVEHDLKGARRQ